MSNYLLLYRGGGMPETEAETKAVMQAWNAWFGQLGSAVVDGGNPTTPNAKAIGTDGTVTAAPGDMIPSGYSIIKADSLDAAVTMAKGCPVLKSGAQILVLETLNAM